MSPEVFHLPDVGEGLVEAEIVAWKVAIGDTIALNQPLVDIETAKATVELPSPYAGTVTALHGAVGDVVEVGAPLVEVATALDGSAPLGSSPRRRRRPSARPCSSATGSRPTLPWRRAAGVAAPRTLHPRRSSHPRPSHPSPASRVRYARRRRCGSTRSSTASTSPP